MPIQQWLKLKETEMQYKLPAVGLSFEIKEKCRPVFAHILNTYEEEVAHEYVT